MDTSQADAELEALLKEQAEFLKSGKPAAAKVTRSAPPTIGSKHTSGAGVGAPHGPSYEPQLPILNPDVVMPPLPKKKPPPQVSEASDRFERAAAEAEAHLLPPVLTEIREREPSVGVVMPPFMPPSAASSAPSASGGPLLGRRPPRGGFRARAPRRCRPRSKRACVPRRPPPPRCRVTLRGRPTAPPEATMPSGDAAPERLAHRWRRPSILRTVSGFPRWALTRSPRRKRNCSTRSTRALSPRFASAAPRTRRMRRRRQRQRRPW